MKSLTTPRRWFACMAMLAIATGSNACRERPHAAGTPDAAAIVDFPNAEPSPDSAPATAAAMPAGERPPAMDATVAEWRRDIQQREQTIQDLEAAVVMERAKLDESPDYDTSFLQQVLDEQRQHRAKLEHARQKLEALRGGREP